MPNGVDRNFGRLATCVAAYHSRFKAWPTYAQLHPLIRQDLVHLFDEQNFEQLVTRMELRTETDENWLGISVGGPRGLERYEEVDYDRLPSGAYEEAERWLGVEVRPELTRPGRLTTNEPQVAERRELPLVPIEQADFRIRDDGVTFHVRPTSEAGREWVAEHSESELSSEGGISVKPGLLDEVILDIEADGLRFGPNEGGARVDFFPGESEDP